MTQLLSTPAQAGSILETSSSPNLSLIFPKVLSEISYGIDFCNYTAFGQPLDTGLRDPLPTVRNSLGSFSNLQRFMRDDFRKNQHGEVFDKLVKSLEEANPTAAKKMLTGLFIENRNLEARAVLKEHLMVYISKWSKGISPDQFGESGNLPSSGPGWNAQNEVALLRDELHFNYTNNGHDFSFLACVLENSGLHGGRVVSRSSISDRDAPLTESIEMGPEQVLTLLEESPYISSEAIEYYNNATKQNKIQVSFPHKMTDIKNLPQRLGELSFVSKSVVSKVENAINVIQGMGHVPALNKLLGDSLHQNPLISAGIALEIGESVLQRSFSPENLFSHSALLTINSTRRHEITSARAEFTLQQIREALYSGPLQFDHRRGFAVSTLSKLDDLSKRGGINSETATIMAVVRLNELLFSPSGSADYQIMLQLTEHEDSLTLAGVVCSQYDKPDPKFVIDFKDTFADTSRRIQRKDLKGVPFSSESLDGVWLALEKIFLSKTSE